MQRGRAYKICGIFPEHICCPGVDDKGRCCFRLTSGHVGRRGFVKEPRGRGGTYAQQRGSCGHVCASVSRCACRVIVSWRSMSLLSSLAFLPNDRATCRSFSFPRLPNDDVTVFERSCDRSGAECAGACFSEISFVLITHYAENGDHFMSNSPEINRHSMNRPRNHETTRRR